MNIKVCSWNCHFGLTEEKKRLLLEQCPDTDIFVIQECREQDTAPSLEGFKAEWFGDDVESQGTKHEALGIGIFYREADYTVSKDNEFADRLKACRYILPLQVSMTADKTKSFHLFAVWTKEYESAGVKYTNYHKPVYNAFELCPKIDGLESAIWIGDFNTGSEQGAISEKWLNKLNDHFKKVGYKNCQNDKDIWLPTFFRGNGNWVDDHCYMKGAGLLECKSCKLGDPRVWTGDTADKSDHIPIIVTLSMR